jgi:hypothetical protein
VEPESTRRDRKRQAARFGAGLPAILRGRGAEHPCEAIDLSRSGALLVGALPESPESRPLVTIRTSEERLRLDCRVRVVRTARDTDGQVVIGVRFVDLDDEQVKTLELLIARVVEGSAPAPLRSLPAGAGPEEVRRALEKVSLPHRIALAGRASARERAYLMQDPHPQVLEALARNPTLNLHEAKALLRMHQLLPTTLDSMADDPRWGTDEELKILLATHPRTTVQIAEKVISRLSESGVNRVLQRSGLPLEVKAKLLDPQARRRLTRR